MGFFSYLFSSPGNKYSPHIHPVPEIDILRILSEDRLPILNQDKVHIVEQAVIRARIDGRISLRKIYRTLLSLQHRGSEHERITIEDRHKIMDVFSGYFAEHFHDSM